MTPQSFNDLYELEQIEFIYDAAPVAERVELPYHVILYQKDRLYVEVYYHLEHGFIRKFVPFTKMELLDIYINEIKLDDIF